MNAFQGWKPTKKDLITKLSPFGSTGTGFGSCDDVHCRRWAKLANPPGYSRPSVERRLKMKNNLPGSGRKHQTKRKRRITIALLSILLFLVIIYLGIGAYAVGEVTKIGEHEQYDDTPATYGLHYQDVHFAARGDEVQIAAWYIPNNGSTQAVILVHGRDASKQNAISGKIVELGAALHDAGFTVMMIDLRGHGESEGDHYSFGVYERRDVLGAVDFLLNRGFIPGSIGVLGISMGGGATTGATSEEAAIGALVLESTFADLKPLIEEQWENESGMPKSLLPGVFLMNKLIYGYDLTTIQPVNEIINVPPRPILIIHCTTDELVGMWHPQTLAEAVPSAETAYFDACNHAEIFRDYPDEYKALVIPFFQDNLE
jgi:pimeloyl-ACP methyl ester carboxylesterase